MRTVRLHRDPTVGGVHVLALPPWLPPSAPGLYWHQPRSAEVRADGRVVVRLWCGQYRFADAGALRLTDEAPDDLRCGTCVGRRLGYDGEGGHVFRPRDHWQLPRWCPSTDPDPDDWSLCAACGRRTSAARGWNSSGLAAHAPDPAITDRYQPCPRHGWRDMRVPYGRVGPLRDVLVCGFFRCGFESFRRPAPRLS